ncbi:MAG: hypothetical protein AABW92_04130 [Nanoarchaeota archaeon]
MSINKIMEELPSSEVYKHSMFLLEAEKLGIAFCGDNFFEIIPIYKMLTNDKVMHIYYRVGTFLFYVGSQELHD